MVFSRVSLGLTSVLLVSMLLSKVSCGLSIAFYGVLLVSMVFLGCPMACLLLSMVFHGFV